MLQQQSPAAEVIDILQSSPVTFDVAITDHDGNILDLSAAGPSWNGFIILREKIGAAQVLQATTTFVFSDGSSGTNVQVTFDAAQTAGMLPDSVRQTPTHLIGDLLVSGNGGTDQYWKRLDFAFMHATTDFADYPPSP